MVTQLPNQPKKKHRLIIRHSIRMRAINMVRKKICAYLPGNTKHTPPYFRTLLTLNK